jgi:hypothetical protein
MSDQLDAFMPHTETMQFQAHAIFRDRFPKSWYWRADDGRIFAAQSGDLVPAEDPDYASFLALGMNPTRWPTDEAGEQTSAALDAVLAPYGISANPAA